MDNIENLFSSNGGQGLKSLDNENHIQGMFYDLLACLGGGDNPKLPPGFKPKAMTGFCDILEAFDKTIKIREAGSAVVCEVNSSEAMSPAEQMSNKASDETLKTSDKESGQACNSDSVKSFVSRNELSTTEADCSQSNSSMVNPKGSDLDFFNRMTAKLMASLNTSKEQDQKEKDRLDQANNNYLGGEAEIYEDAFDFDGENPILAMLKTSLLESVGPPLTLSGSQLSMARPMSDGRSELDNYSDELKDVDQILKENIPNASQFIRSQFPQGGMSLGALMGNGILPSFPDPLMNPSVALAMLYNVEFCKDASQQSSSHISRFESCTSIPGVGENHPGGARANPFEMSLPFPFKTLPPLYENSVKLDEVISDADFIAALDAELLGEEGGSCKHDGNPCKEALRANVDMPEFHLDDGDDKSTPYYSVHEESDKEEAASAAGRSKDKSKKQKKKKRLQSKQRAKTELPSKAVSWTWTSASDSEYGDAH